METKRLPGNHSFRISEEATDCAKRLVATGRFRSMYQVCLVGVLQAASNQSILTPGTLARLPPQDDTRPVLVRTYLSKKDAQKVFAKLGSNVPTALDRWLRLVGGQDVPAAGTTALMKGYKHHGPQPSTFSNLGAAHRPAWGGEGSTR